MKRFCMLGVSTLLVLVVAACGESRGGNAANRSPVQEEVARTTVDDVDRTIAAAPSTASAGTVGAVGTPGVVNGDESIELAGSCAVEYNAATLAERSWAFDGTLVPISTRNDTRLDAVPTATFTVNRWYRGGTDGEVTVDYDAGPAVEFSETGNRMLVAGEPRWGGATLEDAVAWGCGFTQPWTSTAAEQWSAVFAT